MRNFLLLILLAMMTAISSFARDFTYTYEGQTITYTVIDEETKTCKTKDGASSIGGNYVSGDLVLPANPKDGDTEFTLTEIGDHAFSANRPLTSVIIPNSVQTIGESAFRYCSTLISVTIPYSVTSIGDFAFTSCKSLKQFIVDQNNPNYTAIDGSLFNKDITEILISPGGKDGDYNIPNSVQIIGSYAFYDCSGLTSVVIPNSVQTIGESAFYGCSGLKKLTIEDDDSTLSFGDGPFYSTPIDTLYIGRNWTHNKEYSISNEVKYITIGNKVTALPDYAFGNCSALTSFSLSNSVQSIGKCAFVKCTSLTSVVIPNSVQTIGDEAFSRCSGLTSVHIPNSVQSIGSYAFGYCTGLTSIYIPNSVNVIGYRAFGFCSGLKKFIVEDSETSIALGGDIFSCDQIDSLYMGRNWAPKSSMEGFSFESGIKSLTIGNKVTSILSSALVRSSDLTSVYIGNSVKTIGMDAFLGCSQLESIYIGSSVQKIDWGAFRECNNLKNVEFASIESLCKIQFSNSDANPLSYAHYLYINGEEIKDLKIPNSVTAIGNYAFSDCSGLTSAVIPNSVTSIGSCAFQNCTSLTSVDIGNSVQTIGNCAFQKCSGLTSILLPDSLMSIGYGAFYGCDKIENIYHPTYNPAKCLDKNVFSEIIYEKATLWVKPSVKKSIDNYYPWNQFKNIKIGFISSIILSEDNWSAKIGDEITLNATAMPDSVQINDVVWSSSNTNIAAVDENGKVTAINLGNTTITATCGEWSASCNVTVSFTPIESIEIIGAVSTLKKGRTLELSVSVLPENATNKNILWISSDKNIATIDEAGVVTALEAGQVTITAITKDGSDKYATATITVVPPIKGDSNDNDVVNIADAVNIANYVVGNEVEYFCFEASDVNEDEKITFADASGTVTIILDQPNPASAFANIQAISAYDNDSSDRLVISNYSARIGESHVISIALQNNRDYVAMQADITLPEGTTLESVKAGNRIADTHSLAYKRINDNTIRVALYDLGNNVFADNDEAVIELCVRFETDNTGDICVNNIIASDIMAHEYYLTSTGGHNNGNSGVDNSMNDNIIIESSDNAVNIYNAEGKTITISMLDGRVIAIFTAESDAVSYALANGFYLISAGDKTSKVIVK